MYTLWFIPCLFLVCTSIMRQEVQQMKLNGDFKNYTRAFDIISNNNQLDNLVQLHGKYWNTAHFNQNFLLWHRLYIFEFEKLLKEHECNYLPYWDWSSENNTEIFQKDFFGSDNLMESVFNISLKRNTNYTFYTWPFVENIINTFDSFSEFSIHIEYGPHALVHVNLGKYGVMNTWKSPQDPIFWVHHAFIDKIFTMWQEKQKQITLPYEGIAYNKTGKITDMINPFNVNVEKSFNLLSTYTENIHNMSGPLILPPIVNVPNIDPEIIKKIDESNKKFANSGIKMTVKYTIIYLLIPFLSILV